MLANSTSCSAPKVLDKKRTICDSMVMKEEWRPVFRYEGLYEVSSRGRVKSLGRWKKIHNGGRFFVKEHQVALCPIRGGYVSAALWKNGRGANRPVHQLVLEAWKGPRPVGMVSCHNDGIRTNNAPKNLRWDTIASNSADVDKHGNRYKGAGHHSARLNDTDVRKIKRRLAKGDYQYVIAKDYGISQPAVGKINRGLSWKHVT